MPGAPGWFSRLNVQFFIWAQVPISRFMGSWALHQALHWQGRACLGFSVPLPGSVCPSPACEHFLSLSLSLSLSQNKLENKNPVPSDIRLLEGLGDEGRYKLEAMLHLRKLV